MSTRAAPEYPTEPIDLAAVARDATGYAFDVLCTTDRLQAAFMSLAPQEGSGRGSVHEHADQLVYVLSGTGVAVINGIEQHLRAGALTVIPAGRAHEIRNTGIGLLVTLNVYAPAAY